MSLGIEPGIIIRADGFYFCVDLFHVGMIRELYKSPPVIVSPAVPVMPGFAIEIFVQIPGRKKCYIPERRIVREVGIDAGHFNSDAIVHFKQLSDGVSIGKKSFRE